MSEPHPVLLKLLLHQLLLKVLLVLLLQVIMLLVLEDLLVHLLFLQHLLLNCWRHDRMLLLFLQLLLE